MATAIQEYRKLQIGKESTKGTAIAATKQLFGEWKWTEELERYFPAYPRGQRATIGGAGTALRRGTMLDYDSDLSPEEITPFAASGLLGGITPTTTDTTGKLWVFSPGLTGIPVLDSFTFEIVETDGATNHYARRFAYGMTQSMKLSYAFNQPGKFSAKVFGRALLSNAPTAGQAGYTGREELASNGTSVAIDTTWAALGGTLLTGTMRSCDIEYQTGLGPNYTLDARTDLDMTIHRYGKVGATINLTMELEAQAATLWGNYRNGDIIFIRVKTTGSLITAVNKYVQNDLCIRLTSSPSVSGDGSIRLVSFSGEALYDTTSGKIFELTVLNKLAASA